MATINLGSIKFNWKGTYAGGTAYAVDDVVSYNGSSYICTAASTGNLPTDTNFWDQMSSAGTNGTDLTTTLTTQGDIVYRDGSGLQRLGAGTAGQVLQTGGTGANPSWGTVSSDYVKLAETNVTSNVSSVDFESVFTSDYDIYKIFVSGLSGSGAFRLRTRMKTGTTLISSTDYYYVINGAYKSSSTDTTFSHGERGQSYFQLYNWDVASSNVDTSAFEITVYNPLSTNHYTTLGTTFSIIEGGFTYQATGTSNCTVAQNTAYDGIQFGVSANFIDQGKFQVYGIK